MATKKKTNTRDAPVIDYAPRTNDAVYFAKAIGEALTLPETDRTRLQVYLRKLIEVIGDKQNKPSVVTQSAPSAITLADNTQYYLTDVSSLTLTYPTGNFECWFRITTASSGTISISIPTSAYIGDVPIFDNGETWELSIKDGIIVAGEVIENE